jgi:hypothetical protein
LKRMLLLMVVIVAGLEVNCGGTSGGSGGSNPPPPPEVTVNILPTSANVRAGATQPFTGTVSGSSNQGVTWEVNGTAGGSATTGTISSGGSYTAPASVPSTNTVTIQAVSLADSSAQGTSSVTLWNPTPVLSTVSPLTVAPGAITLNITGGSFVAGAQVFFGSSELATTVNSSTSLTATGTAAAGGTIGVYVMNPDPGSSLSSSINVQVSSGGGTAGTCNGISLGQGAALNGFLPFPASNPWNTNIANATVDPNSSALINFIGGTVGLHADFGSGEYNGQSIGIPYVVVGSGQSLVGINFTAYGDESDPGPMPVPADAPIEGYPAPGTGDRHVLVVDNSNCWLYEMDNSYAQTDGSWNADSAAVWDLQNNEQRPWTWTSADAAGLPIFAGLARYDEVANGAINHALRFTLQSSRAAFVPPASHYAPNSTNANAAPMGMRLRLKASFDISGYSATNQVLLTAMKQYGLIMADNGSSMFISGTPDDRWDNDDLHNLGNVTASDFDVVLMNPIYTSTNYPQGANPTITSFTASTSTISAGTPVTLNWDVTGAGYYIVSPDVGAVRETTATVSPAQTTTYTLYATNQYGRTTATLTVTVQ